MSHSNHEKLPGYSPGQVFTDGCAECVARSLQPDHGIAMLDRTTFARAWGRAEQRARDGLPDIADAEYDLLLTLGSVQWQLKQLGLLT